MSVLISLVIPILTRAKQLQSWSALSVVRVYQPEEVILVDGGSTDNTLQILNEMTINKQKLRIISVKKAMPGKGRNIGSAQAACEWIAYTDAGIKLDQHWLEQLVKRSEEIPEADIIYGNFSPQINSFFDKCAAISYVPALLPGRIRTKSIASCLLKKEVWEKDRWFSRLESNRRPCVYRKSRKDGL
ncbi:MAG: glycosyltransferase family 2 protein [Chitinophagaceae bacterium]|nr:glycosyltransferase family 2 protein [Chitinophagaceae bacterium]